jgi:hypothetical protein
MPMSQWPIISEVPWVQAHYEACREEGTSHNLAEMFALAAPPMSNTDREFLHGHCNGNQFAGQEGVGDEYRKTAAAAGVNVTGKVYLTQLARYPGDPEAWVDGKGDVERVCTKRGWGATGLVNVKPVEKQHAPDIPVADNLLDAEVEKICDAQPDSKNIDKVELREQVLEKRKPHWAKPK